MTSAERIMMTIIKRLFISSVAAVALMLSGLLLFPLKGLAQTPTVSVGTASGAAGTNVNLPVSFTAGTTGVSGIQFDLVVPSSLTYVSTATGSAATAAGKSASANVISGGVRVVIIGFNQTTIGSGSIAIVTFSIASGTTPGTLTIGITNVASTDPPGNTVPSAATGGSINVLDTTPPSVPTNLTATAASTSQINLSWTASTDNVGVTGYKVFRNGTQVGTPTATTFQDTGLAASTMYSYTVSAYDAAGNNSAPSAAATATTLTPPDTTPPTVPTNLVATAASTSQINLSWTASTDNVGVTGYKVFRNGTQVGTPTATTFQDTGLAASTMYSYTVSAYDAAGNNSAQSSSASATTLAPPDTIPPTVPTNLITTVIGSSQINLSWTASTDNVGVAGYKIFRNGAQVGTSIGTTYSDVGLAPATSYSYTVSAFDAAGNNSAQSTTATATTSGVVDTTPPTVPTNLAATAVSSSQINLSWTASTDNVGVTGYKIYRNGSQIGTSGGTTYQDTGLAASTTYTYTVSAFDVAGNNSAQSAPVTAATLAVVDTTPPVISGVSAGSITTSSAMISWSTNKVTDAQVEYGGTAAYGNSTNLDQAMGMNHSELVSGLAPNTLYHYRVKSRDALGNLGVSADYTFTTTANVSQGCSMSSHSCYSAPVPANGGTSRTSSGQGNVSTLYGQLTLSSIPQPVAFANSAFTQSNVLLTEVGVSATPGMNYARMFVDYANGLESGVALINLGSGPNSINLDLRNQAGLLVFSTTVNLDARAHLARFLSQIMSNLPKPFLGTLTLSSASPFAAINLRSAVNGHGETIFSALPVTDLSNPPSGTRLIFPQIVDGGGAPTQILLLNPSSASSSAGSISLYDDSGNPLALDFGLGVGMQSTLNYSLPPSGMLKFSTTGLGALRTGYAVVTPVSGNLPVGSVVFSVNGSTGLASQAGVLNASETNSARLFVEGTNSPLNRNTGIAVVNRNNAQATLNLTFVSDDGSSQTKTLTLDPSSRVVRFMTELFPGLPNPYQGVLTISSSIPVAPLTLRLTINQRGENIYSTLPVVDLNRPPAGPLFIPQIVDGGGYQTQLIFLNTSSTSGSVRVDFFNDNGTAATLNLQ